MRLAWILVLFYYNRIRTSFHQLIDPWRPLIFSIAVKILIKRRDRKLLSGRICLNKYEIDGRKFPTCIDVKVMRETRWIAKVAIRTQERSHCSLFRRTSGFYLMTITHRKSIRRRLSVRNQSKLFSVALRKVSINGN